MQILFVEDQTKGFDVTILASIFLQELLLLLVVVKLFLIFKSCRFINSGEASSFPLLFELSDSIAQPHDIHRYVVFSHQKFVTL